MKASQDEDDYRTNGPEGLGTSTFMLCPQEQGRMPMTVLTRLSLVAVKIVKRCLVIQVWLQKLQAGSSAECYAKGSGHHLRCHLYQQHPDILVEIGLSPGWLAHISSISSNLVRQVDKLPLFLVLYEFLRHNKLKYRYLSRDCQGS